MFAAHHIVEGEQLEKNINIMVQRGQLKSQSDGNYTMTTSDHYAAFQNIRGSPKYFQTARNELLARVAQLGPFQLFFTLSCAEMRWPEIIATLLKQNGHKVICTNEEELEYTVDGELLDIFLENSDITKHDLFKDNIVTVSRMFDHRVKKFVQHLLKSFDQHITVDYYNYRVEFQMRGMAHIHGVIWIAEDKLKEYKEPNSNAFDSDKIPQLIDNLITCSLPQDDDKLRKIVEDVQTPNHTKTCRKYNDTCRFGYPRFPSIRTIVSKPLRTDKDDKDKQDSL